MNLFPSVKIRVKTTGMCCVLACVRVCVRMQAPLVLFLTCQMCAEIKSSGVSDSLPWLHSDFAVFILFSLWLEKDTSASFKEAGCSTKCSPVTSVSTRPASSLMDSWIVPLLLVSYWHGVGLVLALSQTSLRVSTRKILDFLWSKVVLLKVKFSFVICLSPILHVMVWLHSPVGGIRWLRHMSPELAAATQQRGLIYKVFQGSVGCRSCVAPQTIRLQKGFGIHVQTLQQIDASLKWPKQVAREYRSNRKTIAGPLHRTSM